MIVKPDGSIELKIHKNFKNSEEVAVFFFSKLGELESLDEEFETIFSDGILGATYRLLEKIHEEKNLIPSLADRSEPEEGNLGSRFHSILVPRSIGPEKLGKIVELEGKIQEITKTRFETIL
jgi:hypothetical protein